MKVRCIGNSERDLPKEFPISGHWGADAPHSFALTIGKEYLVYAVLVSSAYGAWYYIRDENFVWFPIWNPAPLFEITDGAQPTCWRAGPHLLGDEKALLIAYPEW